MAIINPRSLTPEQIQADITAWLDANRVGWRDRFPGSHGTTLIELLAGKGAFQAYQARSVTRENNLDTARLTTSIRGFSYTFGYVINRRKAARISVTLANSTGSDIPLARTNNIGLIASTSRKVSLIEDTTIRANESTRVDCVVGEWKSSDPVDITDEDFYEYEFIHPSNVNFVDNELVEVHTNLGKVNTVRYIEDMGGHPDPTVSSETSEDELSVAVLTAINSIIVTFGSENLGRRVKAGDGQVSIRYVDVSPIQGGEDTGDVTTVYNLDNFQRSSTLPDGLTVTGLQLISREVPEDNIGKVKRIVPGYFASRRRMITASDHESVILGYDQIYDAKYADQKICSINPDDTDRQNQRGCEAEDNTFTTTVPLTPTRPINNTEGVPKINWNASGRIPAPRVTEGDDGVIETAHITVKGQGNGDWEPSEDLELVEDNNIRQVYNPYNIHVPGDAVLMYDTDSTGQVPTAGVYVLDGGSGYDPDNPPTVEIRDTLGTGVELNPSISSSGSIDSVDVTGSPTGYPVRNKYALLDIDNEEFKFDVMDTLFLNAVSGDNTSNMNLPYTPKVQIANGVIQNAYLKVYDLSSDPTKWVELNYDDDLTNDDGTPAFNTYRLRNMSDNGIDKDLRRLHINVASGTPDILVRYTEWDITITYRGGVWLDPQEDPCVNRVAYLVKGSNTTQAATRPFNDNELDALDNYLDNHRILGVRTVMQHGIATSLDLDVKVLLTPEANVSIVKQNILDIIEKQCYILGGTFDVAKVNMEMQDLDNIILSRIHSPSGNKTLKWSGYFLPPDNADFIRVVNRAEDVGVPTVRT